MLNHLRVTLERTLPEAIYRRVVDNRWVRWTIAKRSRMYIPMTPVHLCSTLKELGVVEGDVLLVHSSYDKLRGMEGGVTGIVQALFDAVGTGGTIMMPTFAQGPMQEVVKNRRFDVRRTPSEMGLLTEVFRRMEDVERSLHPYHSVAAKGPLAAWLVKDHAASLTPFGSGTPFGRLIEVNGKVLVMGVGLHWSLTIVHVVEDMMGPDFPIPVYLDRPVKGTVIDEQGTIQTVLTKVHDDRIRKRMNLSLLGKYLRGGDILKTKSLDGVEIHLLNAKGVVDRLTELAWRGVTIYA